MKWLLVLGGLLSTYAFSANAVAGDIEAGREKSKMCMACHGVDGIAKIPGYPHLKGQDERYLVSSMNAYKNGERTGTFAAIMASQVNQLSDEDIKNLAAFYASLK